MRSRWAPIRRALAKIRSCCEFSTSTVVRSAGPARPGSGTAVFLGSCCADPDRQNG